MTAPIGVFDSGVGGLSVLRELVRLMPAEAYVYLGDSARVPYGNKSAETVRLFAEQCTQFLLDQHVKLIVVACNTVSAVALDAIQQAVPVPLIGMIEPAAAAALDATRSGHIGIAGTRATIGSNAYATAIQRLQTRCASAVTIHSLACPLFVPLVEEGWIDHPATQLIAREYLAALLDQPAATQGGAGTIDTLVLGCTHYPLLKPLLRDLLPNVNLIDCGEHAARVAGAWLHPEVAVPTRNGHAHTASPNVRFCLTDIPPTFASIAERFLGFAVNHVERVVIDHLSLAPV